MHAAAQTQELKAGNLGIPQEVALKILDSIRSQGPKLIELATSEALRFRTARPDLSLIRKAEFRLARAEQAHVVNGPKLAGLTVALTLKITVTGRDSGAPVAGARVVALTNFAAKQGEEQLTDENGTATFELLGGSKKLDRFYIYPNFGFWPRLEQAFTLKTGAKFSLEPVRLDGPDSLRFHYPDVADDAGAGVRVAVIDSGVAKHADLKVERAACTVTGEDADDGSDVTDEGHGTHVSGIVAARGKTPKGMRGLAPGVSLHVYRVVPKGSALASNFAIAKAIDLAIDKKADLINLSIEGVTPDPLVRQALQRARMSGIVVVAAAGNGNRQPVAFPASDSFALAVSATGRKGLVPADSPQALALREPVGTDGEECLADFSNIGDDLDFAAPGVGIVSTVPNGYAVMDGTSMACPAVTGAGATLLSRTSTVRDMERGEARAEALTKLMVDAAKSLGLGPVFEGHGLIRL